MSTERRSRAAFSDTMHDMSDLRPEAMTWTALLGKWLEFAKASVALPDDADGRRWKQSVTPIVTLQAVTFALDEIDDLAAMDRPHALDRAEMLIDEHAGGLDRTWSDVERPGMIDEVIRDARGALASASAVTELIWPGPGPLDVPDFEIEQYRGTLAVMQPGTRAMPGEPIAWWIGGRGLVQPGAKPSPTRHPRQVYREITEDGSMTRDIIALIEQEMPANALPLLVPLFEDGEAVGHFTLDAEQWAAHQREALTDEEIEVVDRSSDGAGGS